MVEIRTIASSSAGNCYWISDGFTPLLLEAGIRISRIRESIGFSLSSIGGALITHEHRDHSKAVKDLMKAAVDCYMSAGTALACGVNGHRLHQVAAGRDFKVGTWTIVPFATVHDAKEPLGFLLGSGTSKLLFVTDTAYIHPRFTGITHIMIECNYCEDVMNEKVEEGYVSVSMKKRLLFSHFGLKNVLEFLRSTDLSNLQSIHLLHASNGNSNVEQMKTAVQGITGCPVYIADE